MNEENNTGSTPVPPPSSFEAPTAPGVLKTPAPEPVPAPQPAPIPQPMPAAQPIPHAQTMHSPYGSAPAAPVLTQLSGGMKFGWLVIGLFMGIPGMILAWLVNVDKFPQVKSDAVKFAVIGFVINIALAIMFALFISTMMAVVMGQLSSSYNYL